MTRAIALVPTDLKRTRLGLPSHLDRALPPGRGVSILEHTVRRLCAIPNVAAVVLVHPADQDPLALLAGKKFARQVAAFPDPNGLLDPYHAYRAAARKWALTSWRGGLGGMTCYDELLPAEPLAAALAAHKADAALLVGADWPLVDPALCARVLDLHLSHPEELQMTFCQAPPGLAGVAVGAKVLKQLAENAGSSIGQAMAYHPTRPQADPIGRDVCVQIAGEIRSCTQRLIYDTPRAIALIDTLAAHLGDELPTADAAQVVRQVADLLSSASPLHHITTSPHHQLALPQQVTLELTPQRASTPEGTLTPQHYVALPRTPMRLEMALRIVRELGSAGDIALTLGGLGDALLYEHWLDVVTAAHDSGVLGIAIETDLLVEKDVLDRLLDAPIDLVSVRLNADSAATYKLVHGVDAYTRVLDNIAHLMNRRTDRERAYTPAAGPARHGLPWIVPRFIKTVATLPEMETFFDRWVHFTGHAAIDPPTRGQGPHGPLMPDMSPVPMAPPRRRPCRQLGLRMTIHSDGRVARCDQDWLAAGAVTAPDSASANLTEAWTSMAPLRTAHTAGSFDPLGICTACGEWHRP